MIAEAGTINASRSEVTSHGEEIQVNETRLRDLQCTFATTVMITTLLVFMVGTRHKLFFKELCNLAG